MATQIGQTISAQDFNKLYGVGTTVSADEFNKLYAKPKPMYQPMTQPKNTLLDTLGRITGVKNYAQDVGAGITANKTAAVRGKQNAAAEAQAKAIEDQAYATTDMARRSYLLKQANVIRQGQSAAARDVASTFSPDIEKSYLKRGVGTAARIAGTADLISGLVGSPAIGAFKQPAEGFLKGTVGLNKPASLAPKDLIGSIFKPTGQQSVVKTIAKGTKLLTSSKTSGKALEVARSKVPVDVNEFRNDIVNNVKKSTEYVTDQGVTRGGNIAKGTFQKDVDEVLRKMTVTMKNRNVTSLQEFTQNLEKMKDVNPEAVKVVKTALRESEKAWGNQPIERLATLYHVQKMIEPTAKYVGKRAATVGVDAAILYPLLKSLGIIK